MKSYLAIAALLLSLPANAQTVPGPKATMLSFSTVGTTAVVTATLPAVASLTNWICGFSIRSTATAAIAGDATITGPTNTLHFEQGVGLSPAVVSTIQDFNPCLPATSVNTAIVVNSIAAGSGGVTSVTVWGYTQP